MKLSAIAASAVLAFAASSSYAVDIVQPIVLTAGTGTFGVTHATGGAFTDSLTFTLTTTSALSSSITSINLGTQDLTFTSVSLNGTPYIINMQGAIDLRTLTGLTLPAGSYAITVVGSSVGAGSYAGTLNVSPVPEPQVYALLLAGLAGMGFIARRRKQEA